MRKFSDKAIVIAFARMNPPSLGHQKLINKVLEIAKIEHADQQIIVSYTHDSKNNPLSIDEKMDFLGRLFPNAGFEAAGKNNPTLMHHLSKLYDLGYSHVTVVAGSDRVPDFERMAIGYNGETGGKYGYFKFKSVDVVSAGERDPDSDGIDGVSGSKMRYLAKNGNAVNKKLFFSMLPKPCGTALAHQIYAAVCKGLE
jgi:hypothetical protein